MTTSTTHTTTEDHESSAFCSVYEGHISNLQELVRRLADISEGLKGEIEAVLAGRNWHPMIAANIEEAYAAAECGCADIENTVAILVEDLHVTLEEDLRAATEADNDDTIAA
jgi:hypothetical protein